MIGLLPLLFAAAVLLLVGGARVIQASNNGLGWLAAGAGLVMLGVWAGLEVLRIILDILHTWSRDDR
jgi:hypothetical protein